MESLERVVNPFVCACYLLVFSSILFFMSNKMESEPPTHTSSFDTFHGVRDHKKKKDIHLKGARKVRISLEEKKKEVNVPMVVEDQEYEASTSTPCLKAKKRKAKVNY